MKNDDMMQYVFDIAKEAGLARFEEYYKMIFDFILKKYRDTGDDSLVKFVLKDPATEEIPLEAVCLIEPEVIKLENPNDAPPVPPKKGGLAPKKPAPAKVTFEPFWAEKTLLMPTISDKLKIIAINKNFDSVFRNNFIECINKLYKLEPDKETFIEPINETYSKIISGLLSKLGQTLEKEIVQIGIASKKDDEEEGEGDEQSGEKEE